MVWTVFNVCTPETPLKVTSVVISILITLIFTGVTQAATTQYHYDANGRLVEVVTSDGFYYTYEYDDTGNIVSEQIAKDSDGDGLTDPVEDAWGGCLDPDDADSDDDGIPDGTEDANHNGQLDDGETHPCKIDTDGDGIQDGTELGYTLADIGDDTDTEVFQPDEDPGTTTDPNDPNTDGDGAKDGEEDANGNGKVDEGETDPNDPSDNNGGGIFFPVRTKDGNISIIFVE